MGKKSRIKVIGRPRRELDIDLLVQALLAIAERRLLAEHPAEEEQDEASA